MRARAACLTVSALVLAACTVESSAHERARSWRDTLGGITPTGARRLTTITDLHQPETVVYDAEQDVYFVSNMLGYGSDPDGQGYILRASAADPRKQVVFAQSGANGVRLDAPKGMAIRGDTLWVVDIGVLRGFDRHTGAPLGTIDFSAQHPVLLNSVAVSPDGRIRVTDTGILMSPTGIIDTTGDRIFEVGGSHAIRVVAQGKQLQHPNGIVWDSTGNRWIVVGFAPFHSIVYAMTGEDSTTAQLADGPGEFDGVQVTNGGTVLYTSWQDSSVYELSSHDKRQLIRFVPSPAGIGVDTKRHRVLIPMPTQDRVEIWALP